MEPADTAVYLTFLVRQLDRLTTDVASLRDDMQVLTAIAQRQDGTIAALLQETRATPTQIQRMNDRVPKAGKRGALRTQRSGRMYRTDKTGGGSGPPRTHCYQQ